MKADTRGWAGRLVLRHCDRSETHTKLSSENFERNGLLGIGMRSERTL